VRALLEADDHHVTAEDLAAAVQRRHPQVHLTTVYRTLDALEPLGVVDRLVLGAGSAVYHLAAHSHHHLVCTECGAVVELPAEFVAPFTAEIAARFGESLARPHLVVSGRCERCQRGDTSPT
jgi:Fur family transcriptional regulator, ferric uptake regulator